MDIYSLGLVLYRLMNGNRLPFLPLAPNPVRYDDNERALSRRIKGEELPAPAFADAAFADVILRMCAYDKDARYKSATELKQQLLALAGNDKVVPLVSAVGSGALTQSQSAAAAAPLAKAVDTPPEEDGTQSVFSAAPSAVPGVPPVVQPPNAAPGHMVQLVAAPPEADRTVGVFAAPVPPAAAPPMGQPYQAPQEGTKPAKPNGKKKLFIFGGIGIAVVAIVCVVLIAVLGGSGKGGSSSSAAASTGGASTAGGAADVELDETVVVMQPLQTTSGLLFDSVVWGEYVVEGYKYKDYGLKEADLTQFLEGMPFEAGSSAGHEGEIGLSVVPFALSAGDDEYELKYYYEALPGYSFVYVTWYSPLKTSVVNGVRVYKVEGNKLLISNCELDNLRRAYGHTLQEDYPDVDYQELINSEPFNEYFRQQLPAELEKAGYTEYALSFKGRDLVLLREDFGVSVTMVSSIFSEAEGEMLWTGQHYPTYADRVFQDIELLGNNYGGTAWQIGFIDGSSAIDPEAVLYENGYMTIKWAQKKDPVFGVVDEPGDILCGYIRSTGHGFVLIDVESGALYPYQSSKEEYLAGGAGSMGVLEAAALETLRAGMLQDLHAAFANAGVDAAFDELTGEISMDSNILFDFDSAELSDTGMAYLDSFLNAYAAVVLSDTYSGSVAEILVEGHTDTDGEYAYNLALSENRALSVSYYCLETHPELAEIMTTTGHASDFPIYDADGEVDMDASRRVVFQFVLKTIV